MSLNSLEPLLNSILIKSKNLAVYAAALHVSPCVNLSSNAYNNIMSEFGILLDKLYIRNRIHYHIRWQSDHSK